MTSLEENKRVIFLAFSGIGNLIMQLPTIEALKKAHPNWHITVCVAPRGTKELAASQPYIDEVLEMPISKVSFLQHIKNILTLRSHHFDIGIVLSPGQLIKSAAYLKLSGIPIRIGNSYPYKGQEHSSHYLTNAVEEQEHIHDIEQNLRLLESLNIHPSPILHYSLHIPEENIREATTLPVRQAGYNLQPTTSYIGLHAGCAKGFEFKQWPVERFAEVAKQLVQKYPTIQFLIFGGPEEEAQKQTLAKIINVSRSAAGKTLGVNGKTPSVEEAARPISTSLLTTAAIMQQCKLFLSNDSGLMHLAASVGVPTIGIFGPTDERLTGPRGSKGNSIVRAPGTTPVYNTETTPNLGNIAHETLLAISPQMVVDIIEEKKLSLSYNLPV